MKNKNFPKFSRGYFCHGFIPNAGPLGLVNVVGLFNRVTYVPQFPYVLSSIGIFCEKTFVDRGVGIQVAVKDQSGNILCERKGRVNLPPYGLDDPGTFCLSLPGVVFKEPGEYSCHVRGIDGVASDGNGEWIEIARVTLKIQNPLKEEAQEIQRVWADPAFVAGVHKLLREYLQKNKSGKENTKIP